MALIIWILAIPVVLFAVQALLAPPRARIPYANGPKGLPFVGNIFYYKRIANEPDGELKNQLEKWGELTMLWIGRKPVLIVNSTAAAKTLLSDRSAIYSTRPERNDFRKENWAWRLMSEPRGLPYRVIRKLYQSYLGQQQALCFREYQEYESRVLLKQLLTTPASFMSAVERYTLSVTFSVVHGCRVDTLDHPIAVAFYNLWDLVMFYIQPGSLVIDYLPFLQILPRYIIPQLRKVSGIVQQELSLHQAFLENIRTAIKDNTAPACFAADLAKVQESLELDDVKATNIMSMLVGAGSDTTSSYLHQFFKAMALHPEVARTAQKELDAVVGPSRLPNWSDHPNLPYINCIVKELHRWAPVGGLSIPHCAMQDDEYKGCFIPKGTIVFPNLPCLNRDPAKYDHPDEFDPTRFLNDEASAAVSALQPESRDHYHYGHGRRLCPGIHVAEASIFINAARLLWAFNIQPLPGHKLDMTDRYHALIWKPRSFKLKIESRGAEYEQVIQTFFDSAQPSAMNFDDVIKFVPASQEQAMKRNVGGSKKAV